MKTNGSNDVEYMQNALYGWMYENYPQYVPGFRRPGAIGAPNVGQPRYTSTFHGPNRGLSFGDKAPYHSGEGDPTSALSGPGGYGQGHKTAISRGKASAPVQWLMSKGLLKGRVLDFGCGKGDICKFTDIPNAEQWDPTHHPQRPTGVFDTVYNGFVMNVMPEPARQNVMRDIWRFLKPGGNAYIAIRRDVKKEGVQSTGSEQYNAELRLPVIHNAPGKFIIYHLRKR